MTATAQGTPAQRLAEVREQFTSQHQPENLANADILAVRQALDEWRAMEARVWAAEDSLTSRAHPLCGWGPLARERWEHPATVASRLWAVIEDVLAGAQPETLLGHSADMAAERHEWLGLLQDVAKVRNSRRTDAPPGTILPLTGWGPYHDDQHWPGFH